MLIKQATFITSVADFKLCPTEIGIEIAVAGKSNVGKSTFINFLAHNSKLAKTSSTPGRTRLLNYFNINNGEFALVDLPGYGYARVNDEEKNKWAQLIEGYFATSERLKHVLVLVDSRHEPSALDKQMIAYLHHYHVPFTVIATKADKLTRNEIIKQKSILASGFCLGEGNIIVTSATTRMGMDVVLARLDDIIENNQSN